MNTLAIVLAILGHASARSENIIDRRMAIFCFLAAAIVAIWFGGPT